MKDLPEGTKVRVISNLTGHFFETNQIVIRENGEYDFQYVESVAFVSECGEEKWYMTPDEYEIVSYPVGSLENHVKELEAKVKELEQIIEGYRGVSVNAMKVN